MMEAYMWWIVLGAVLLVAALIVWAVVRWQRSRRLRNQFDTEYDHAVSTSGNRRRAEAELEQREERVRQYEIRTLMPEVKDRYAEAWQTIQARFVDRPALAVAEADELITEAMRSLGYPMNDFEEAAADLSVDHPQVVKHYRAARDIAVRSEQGKSSTEELRQAMKHYRLLFEELLERPVDSPLARGRDASEATALNSNPQPAKPPH